MAENEKPPASGTSALRTFASVARVSRLPTVWSNCLAGWWLGGAGHWELLFLLFPAATLLFIGGAFLNGAIDSEHEPSQPLAARLNRQALWQWAVALLVVGGVLLIAGGVAPGVIGLCLAALIVLYNCVHRCLPFAPVLKGACRFCLYLLGAAVAEYGISGWSIWCGLALGAYVTGWAYLAAWEETSARRQLWPLILLAVPIGLALVMDIGRYRESGLLLSAVLLLWSLRCLRPTLWSLEPQPYKTVAGLLTGIVFVDWLATCPANFALRPNPAAQQISIAFLVLFGLTLLLQKLAPEKAVIARSTELGD